MVDEKKKDIDTIKEILAKHDAKECIEQFEKMQTAKKITVLDSTKKSAANK